MQNEDTQETRGSVEIPLEGVASRTVRIRAEAEYVRSAWRDAGIPGAARVENAPADRGVDLRVEIDGNESDDIEHRLSPYEGKSLDQRLESALRDFKARLETGEVATTIGQSSGRRDD